MKNKPTRHKRSNTFKFQPFAERIANIDIDVFHRVGHKFEDDSDENDTFLHQSLQKWNVLNLSESYESLKADLPCVQTLPLLLNQKHEVVSVLQKHLEIKHPLCLQALLEFVVALVRDLQNEVYPFYPELLHRVIDLLATKDAEQLEWAFTCLAYMFKFLWRYLVKDVATVFDSLLPLLSDSRPEYINNFAAESFAFVARKVKDKKGFLALILQTLQKRPDSIVGCGRLMFEVLRGVSGQFHSCAQSLLPLYLNSLADHSLPQRLLFEMLTHTVTAMCAGIRSQHFKLFWTAAFDTVEQFIPGCDKDAESECLVLKLVHQAVSYKDAILLAEPIPTVQHLMKLLEQHNLPEAILMLTSNIGAAILLSHSIRLPQEYASQMTIKILAIPYPGTLLSFVRSVMGYSGFEALVLPRLLKYCSYSLQNTTAGIDKGVLHVLTRLILHKAPPCISGLELKQWQPYLLDFPSTGKDVPQSTERSYLQPFLDILSLSFLDDLLEQIEDVICVLLCLPHFEYLDKDTIVKKLKKMMRILCNGLVRENCVNTSCTDGFQGYEQALDWKESASLSQEDKIQNILFLLSVLLETLIHLVDPYRLQNVCEFESFLDLLLPYATEARYFSALRMLDLYMTACNIQDKPEKDCLELLEKLYDHLAENLSSPFHKIRLVTAHIFSLFEDLAVSSNSEDADQSSFLSICLAAEIVEPTIGDYRDKLNQLQKLGYEALQMDLIQLVKYRKMPLQYLLGVLYINFQLLWEPTIKLIVSHARGMQIDDFWEVFSNRLVLAAKQAKEGGYVIPSITTMTSEMAGHSKPRITSNEIERILQDSGSECGSDIASESDTGLFTSGESDSSMTKRLTESEDDFKCDSDDEAQPAIKKIKNVKEDGCEFLQDMHTTIHEMDDKPDYINYRILLWNALAEFPEVCEAKNRDLTPLFLSFVEEEYAKTNYEVANSWNIRLNACETEDMEVDEPEEDNEVAAVKRALSKKLPPSTGKMNLKASSKSLLAHLGVFAKLRTPKSLYKEPQVNKIYHDLLTHKNPNVQKMALDCLMTYRHKFLLPYKDHLYGLLDDKSFKNEITMFRIDKESTVVQEEHRSDLMPVIMRIVYSRMLTKTGARTSGKASAQLRRSLVLRFLAGCREEEMMVFIKMAFRIYADFIQDDCLVMVKNVMSSVNLESMIPPKRLVSSMNMLGVIMDKFGALMGQRVLPHLLRILLGIGATVAGALAQKESIYPGYITILRSLRSTCIESTARFFDHFSDYPWTSTDIDAVFQVFVWPYLEKLPVEGMQSPTALLKLFSTWSQHSRYFILLAKHAEENSSLTPLPYIMKLLIADKTEPSVINAIMDMVERLVTTEDYKTGEGDNEEDKDCGPPLEITCELPVHTTEVENLSVIEELNYGSCILLPHVPTILERLKRKLGSSRNKGLGQRDLVILSRVSELASDSSVSDTLLQLLVPMLVKNAGAAEDTVMHLLSTLANLLSKIPDPDKYLRSLAPLFGSVSAAAPRKFLCEILERIAADSSDDRKKALGAAARLVGEINAWDAKWVEQPDFSRRLDGFKHVQEMLEADQIDLELGVIIIHNCFFFLKSEKDLSLRDSSGYCLRKLTPALCLKYQQNTKDREFLVSDTVLHLVRAGIRSKNDAVQYEAVSLLGEMARECADVHPVLKDLAKLANKADPEVDFFENILHLQSHRKARALLRFCDVAKNLEKAPNPRTLTQFILPLASSFLCSEKYANKSSIVDAAINTIGMVCRLLPWHQYETILRFYLTKLRHLVEFQKQLVRIVVVILDAFHFDLSRAQQSELNKGVERAQANGIAASSSEPNENEISSSEKVGNNTEDQTEEAVEENLDEILDAELAVGGEEEETVQSAPQPASSRQTTLPHSTALRVTHVIATGLLPQLHRTIAQRSQADSLHKVNRKLFGPDKDEEDILRIPIALAAVKLLQRLPAHMLKQNLPGIIMKLCTFLKSRLDSVRRVTRETLQKIMVALGPSYLDFLLNEMTTLLTRGFHVHVLIYTIHSILVALKEYFKPGDLDLCLRPILEVCKQDLFGAASEEKDVEKIQVHWFEARSTKSYDTLNIVAQHLTEKCLTDFLLPFKEVLASTSSYKTVHKVSEGLRQIVIGLADNTFITIESLIVFVYGMASESIPELTLAPVKSDTAKKQTEEKSMQRPDTFLIPKAPRTRHGALNTTPRNSARTNAHILVEFGLRLFSALLKRDKLRSEQLKPFLDPLVSILANCLKCQHVKLTTIALNCLAWVLKMDLPSSKEHIEDITKALFLLLHKYAAAGLGKGDNFELVVAAFKVVTVLVRDVQFHTISPDQLKALLLYAEQDMHDHSRQASAFSLLKAVMARKLIVPEMHDVMNKVATLSITSDLPHVRTQARQVFHQFLMDYPLGAKLEQHITFYISQLSYELKPGRESALEMMFLIISTFPLGVLFKYSGVIFVALGARLVNDDDPDCRKMVAHCIKTMLSRLQKRECDNLFDIVLLWLKDKKVGHRRLAAQLCGLFVLVEKAKFEHRLRDLMPVLLLQFSNGVTEDNQPGKFVRLDNSLDIDTDKKNSDQKEQMRDHHLFQVLQLLLKLCEHCPALLKNADWRHHVETIAENAEFLLAHPHEWVRLAAAQLLGFVFGSMDIHKVAAAARNTTPLIRDGYLMVNTRKKLRSLVLDLCAQLQSLCVGQELIDQVLKDLVFLGRILKALPAGDDCNNMEDGEDGEKTNLSFYWMVQRMRRVVHMEIIHAPKSTAMRTAVFKWIGAMVMESSREELQDVVQHLFAPLVREMSNEEESYADLRRLAKEVAKMIKQKVGVEEYSRLLMKLQTRLSIRRADRKKLQAQQVITEPEKAAKRKIRKHLKKKDVKKKKLDQLKGRKFPRRKMKRVVEVDET
ncbi:small subunit processome component 20 homolog [Anabrus simplex]|uniref:small subunit processome component 20 homolog n=1 Tax=Anabrus simplex TaxID=316456 RepID=UPI0035A2C1D3